MNSSGDAFSDVSQGDQTPEFVLDASAVFGGMSVRPPGTTGSFTIFDAPNAIDTYANSINAGGDVAGVFYEPGFKEHGFVRDRNGNFTVFDAPNASTTTPESMNDRGDVAGIFTESGFVQHGFVRDRDGNFAVIDPPNALLLEETVVPSINNSGDVTGYFYDTSQHRLRGFVWDRKVVWSGMSVTPPGTNESFTVFDAPNGTLTQPLGINNSGDVTGQFWDSSQGGKARGFVRDRKGNFTVFDAPNASVTLPQCINNSGDVTGQSFGSSPGSLGQAHGFVGNPKGDLTVFDVPSAVFTRPQSINASGAVTGVVTLAGYSDHGFVRDRKGNIAVFDPPNSIATTAQGINARGEIAGYFYDTSQGRKPRGFVLHRGECKNGR